MANIFLDPNDTFTLTSSNTDDSVFGRPGGGETVIIQGAPTGTKLDGNIETVQIAATAAGTTLQINATTGQLEIVSGGVVIGTFSSGLNQSVTLKFSDGDVTLTQIGANSFSIADAANPGTSATVDGANPQTGGAVLANNPTLTVTAAAASVNEGDTATFNVATTNVAAGSTVSYVIGGNAANSANQGDVTGPLTGTATVGADGKATISVAVTSDNVTEGSETLTLTAVTGQLSSTANTTINDTSLSPAALTTADDTLTGGAGDDSYTGTAASLSSERTLNPNDKIDGGAGTDTLSIDMKGSFGGFSSTGFLKNVENVNLTNTGSIAREFDASGATGVQTYSLSGNVNVRDLDSIAGVNVSNRDQGSVSIGYANADVTKGTADTLALGLNNVGTVGVAASGSTPAVTEKVVTVSATGIETVAVTSTGTNVVDLSSVGTKAVTAAGAGNLDIKAVNAGVKTFDGSAASGDIKLDLTAGTVAGVTSVKGGSGNDQFKATSGDLTVPAVVAGGDGNDALALSGSLGTLQLGMSSVETLGIDGATLVFSATNTTGLEKISVSGTGNDATFANLGSADLAFDLKGGATTAATKAVVADNSGTATVNVIDPSSTATNAAPTTNKVDLTVTKAGQVALTVADKMDYEGKLSAGEATSVTAAIKGQTSGAAEIIAGKAQSVVISEVTGANSALKVTAGAATSVQVSNAKDLDLSGSTLSKVETFSSNGAGAINTGDLGAANQVTVENTGAATIGAVGSATQDYSANITVSGSGATSIGAVKTQNQAVNISANNLTGNFAVTSIAAGTGDVNVTAKTTGTATLGATAGKNVVANFADVLGAVTATAGITASNANVTGSSIAANSVNATADTVTFTGGILVDTLTLAGNSGVANGTVTNTLNVTTDLGNDVVTYATKDVAGLTTTLTGTVNLGSGTDSLALSVGGTANGSLNASGLTVTGAETFTISGNAGVNTLVGTAGNDNITLGGGADVVAGLLGKDTIDLGNDGAIDEVHFRWVDGEALTGTSTGDSVSNFTVTGANLDQIVFLDNGTTGGMGAVDFANSADTTAGSTGTALNANDFQKLNMNGLTTDAAIAALVSNAVSGSDTAGNGADNDVLLFIDSAGDDNFIGNLATITFDAQNSYVVAQTSANEAVVLYDADWSDAGGRMEIATIGGTGMSGLDIGNFEVYTTVA